MNNGYYEALIQEVKTNEFKLAILKAKANLEVAELRFKLYKYAIKLNFPARYAERIGDGTYFGCNTNYRAVAGHEFDTNEAEEINKYLDAIDKARRHF